MTAWVFGDQWIISAIRKHIVPEEPLSRAAVGIGVEEALEYRIVISALEVVEACLCIAVVAIVAKMSLFQANIESGKCCLEAADL